MIASLHGEVIGKGEDSLILNLGGIGLRVFVPAALRVQTNLGDRVFLHTFLVVREDALTLFGFEKEDERELFFMLLGVNGVGPRIALAILSTLNADTIRRSVLSEQADVFARVPGVGRKTALKILLHLQGKMGIPEGLGAARPIRDADTEVLEALTSLGYSVIEAQAAIQSISRDASKEVEDRLRFALQYFAG